MMKKQLCTIALSLMIVGSVAIADEPSLDAPASSWVDVPGHGTVWLEPHLSYEHDTGLIRDRTTGARYEPLRPDTSAPIDGCPNCRPPRSPSPVYRPYHNPYSPYPVYQPNRNPHWPPPVYRPSPSPYQPYRPYTPYSPLMPSPLYRPLPHWGSDQHYFADPLDDVKTGTQVCESCGRTVLGSDIDLATGTCVFCGGIPRPGDTEE